MKNPGFDSANTSILSKEFFDFIRENEKADTNSLRLRLAGRPLAFDLEFALMQIEARRAAASKLRKTLENQKFLFPHRLSAEQATAETVAEFHARLGEEICRRPPRPENPLSWLDMTAGLGIDAMAAAAAGFDVTACELNPAAAEVLKYNSQLNSLDINVIAGDSIEWLKNNEDGHWDVIFIDPARRDASASRTYAFADCEPNVVEIMPLLLKRGERIIIKASPMLDISQVIKEIPETTEIFITSLKGGCKEVLVIIDPIDEERKIRCVNLLGSNGLSEFKCSEADMGKQPEIFASEADFAQSGILFEPDASVMKTGAWARLTTDYPELIKIAKDTNLFLAPSSAEQQIKNLPGRLVSISKRLNSKELKQLKGRKLNIVCRNYPMKPDELRKKLKTADGGDDFLYAFRDFAGKPRHLLGQKL